MTMQSPSAELEHEDASEEQNPEPVEDIDPVEEIKQLKASFAELKGSHGELKAEHTKAANFLGRLGREFEALQKQPQTPARDDRVDALVQEFEDFRLGLMDSEEKSAYLLKKARAAEAAAKAPPAKPATTEDHPQARIAREWPKYQKRLAKAAAKKGIAWDTLVTHSKYPHDIDHFRTEEDPDGWDGFEERIFELMDEIEDATTPPKAPASPGPKGGGAGRLDAAAYAKRLKEGGPMPTAEEIDRLTAAYR